MGTVHPVGLRQGRSNPALAVIWAVLAGLALVGMRQPALAQAVAAPAALDAATIERGLEVYRDIARCSYCHGWNGKGSLGAEEAPPPLKTSVLSREQMAEVVRCGRPGTHMPRYLRSAWRSQDRCYGKVLADINQNERPVPTDQWLTDQQIEDVVTFIKATIQGREMTLEHCSLYWGVSAEECDEFKK